MKLHTNNPIRKLCAAIAAACIVKAQALTVVGALFLVAVVILIIAGIVYLAKVAIDAIQRIQADRIEMAYTYWDYDPSEWRNRIGPAIDLPGADPEVPMYALGDEAPPMTPIWVIEWTEDLGLPWVDVGHIACQEQQARMLVRGLRDWHVADLRAQPRKSKSKPQTDPGIGFWRARLIAD